MHPIFLRLGSFDIHWYGVCMALGFLLFLWTLRHFGRGTRRNGDYVSNLLTLLIVFGLGGARTAYVIEHWSRQFAHSPWQVLNLHQGGLMFYGGLIGAWIAMTGFALWHRENYLDFLDFLVTALPIGHAMGRVGCFLEGCCFGARTDGPLGVVYPVGSHAWGQQVAEGLISPASPPLPLYPSQLFEAALLVVLYAALFLHYPRRKVPGGQVAIYAISYAVVRFVIEMFRSDERAHVGPFTISQFISLLLFAFGLVMAAWVAVRRRKMQRGTCGAAAERLS